MEKRDVRAEIERFLAPLGVEAAQIIEEFGLLSITDEAQSVPREAVKKVQERLDSFLKLLEDLIQPDASVASLNEVGFFSEAELQQVRASYQRLMRVTRKYSEAELLATGEAFAAYVDEALACWQAEKRFLLTVTRKLQDGWSTEHALQTDHGYFG